MLPVDSPETARLRARKRWIGTAYGVSLAVLWGGLALGRIVDDTVRGYVMWPALVSIPFAIGGFFVYRRFNRALDHQLRRDRAAMQKPAEVAVTAVAPLLYLSKPPDSPETARIRARRRRAARVVWRCLVIVVVSFAANVAAALAGIGGSAMNGLFLAAVVILVVVFSVQLPKLTGWALLESERRDFEAHREAVAAETARTPVPPVLYLRSFGDDERAGTRYGALTEEEQLAKALVWIGPLLAVGRPGEHLPQVGARRIYIDDSDWQARVTELMSQARLVVLRTGSSEGFRWEVAKALSTLQPEQLLLVVDDMRELRAVLDAIAHHVGKPAKRVRLPGRSIGSVKGIVTFDADWSPRPLRLTRGSLREKKSDERLLARFTLALRPVFDRLGVDYVPPRNSPMRIFYFVLKIFFFVYLIAIVIFNVITYWWF